MLQIRNLTITHTKDLRTILKDFTFALNPGDKAVIIGEEGNGKSTLLKLIYDASLVSGYVEYTGSVFTGNDTLGYLPQELSPETKSLTVYEYCQRLPSFFDRSPKDLSAIAAPLGLSADLFYSDQRIGTLSGGEKVKLMLACLLIERPDILLLDEPSNDLDLDTLIWLETFINTCGLPVLYISHDETLIEKTANVVIHLEQLRRKTEPHHTIARVPYAQYAAERKHRLAHQEQVARKEREEYNKQQEKFRQIMQKVEYQQSTITRQNPHGAALLKKKMKSIKSQERRFDKEYESMTEIPETEDAIFIKFSENASVPNSKKVLDYALDELRIEDEGSSRLLARNIRLRVTGPEKICIIGKNGTGKSTLIKRIAAELLTRTDIHAAYMPQNYEELLDFSVTPPEFLATTGDKEELTRIRTYLGSMKYTADEMDHLACDLSGGQKAKLLLLKMSYDGCNVLILDEPTRNFSPLSGPVIREVLRNYRGTIISISHDRKYMEEVCNTCYELTQEGLCLQI
ncbi:MAG: ABC-F family ATP-binding cassette domain-containing protein [Lachnospiraceae bacterium]|nr:ABC-F family ATP-binding cassette domain-containing protein [Lachnospiraceae bacterium]